MPITPPETKKTGISPPPEEQAVEEFPQIKMNLPFDRPLDTSFFTLAGQEKRAKQTLAPFRDAREILPAVGRTALGTAGALIDVPEFAETATGYPAGKLGIKAPRPIKWTSEQIERGIEELGGRDMYSWYGEIIPDMVLIALTAGGVEAAASTIRVGKWGLKAVSAKKVAATLKGMNLKQAAAYIAKTYATEVPKAAVKLGITGTIYETVTGEAEELPERVIEGVKHGAPWAALALVEPVFPIIGGIKGARISPKARIKAAKNLARGVPQTRMQYLETRAKEMGVDIAYLEDVGAAELEGNLYFDPTYNRILMRKNADARLYTPGEFTHELRHKIDDTLGLEKTIREAMTPERFEEMAIYLRRRRDLIGQSIEYAPIETANTVIDAVLRNDRDFANRYPEVFAAINTPELRMFERMNIPYEEYMATRAIAEREVAAAGLGTRPPTPSKIKVGEYVFAADRQNYGKVLSIGEDTASVHFISREGVEATVDLPLDVLSGAGKRLPGKTAMGVTVDPSMGPIRKVRDAVDRVWHETLSDWGIFDYPEFGGKATGLYPRRTNLTGAGNRALDEVKKAFVPMLERRAGIQITYQDGTKETGINLAENLARSRRSKQILADPKRGEKWLPEGEAEFVISAEQRLETVRRQGPDGIKAAEEIEALVDEVGALGDALGDRWMKNDLIGWKDRADMKLANDYYVPFQRIVKADRLRQNVGLPQATKTIRRMFGSRREIDNVFINLTENYLGMLPEMERQVFRRDAVDALLESGYTGIRPATTQPVINLQKDINEIFRAGGIEEVPTKSMQRAFGLFRKTEGLKRNQVEVIRVKDGRQHRQVYDIDNVLIADQINMNPVHANPTVRAATYVADRLPFWSEKFGLKTFKEIKRAGVTLNPDFFLANFGRDTIQSLIGDSTLVRDPRGKGVVGTAQLFQDALTFLPVSVPRRIIVDIPYMTARLVGVPIEDMFGLTKRGGRPGQFTQYPRFFEEVGATHGEFFRRGGDAKQKARRIVELSSTRKEKGLARVGVTIKNMDKNPLIAAESLFLYGEQVNRAINTERAIKAMLKERGINPRTPLSTIREQHPEAYNEISKLAQATYPEATVNFSEMGKSARVAGRYVPFLTAQLGGVRWLYNAFKKNPYGTSIKAVELITVPSLYLWYRHKKEEETLPEEERWYSSLDAFDLNSRWWLTEHISYPKPFELGFVFGSLPERMMEHYFENDPRAAENAMQGLVQSMPSGFPVPGPVTTGYGLLTGTHPHFESPLERFHDPDEHPYTIYAEYTSEISKFVSKFGRNIPLIKELSPMEYDFIIYEFTGRGGKYVTEWTDILFRQGEGTYPPGKPAAEQIARRYYRERGVMEGSRTKWRTRFYDYAGKVKAAAKEADEPSGLLISKEFEAKDKLIKEMADWQAEIGVARKELMDKIDPRTTTLTPFQIEEEIRKSNIKRNKIAMKGTLQYELREREYYERQKYR